MYYLKPIGVVEQNENYTVLNIFDEFVEGLDGLKEGDYIIVLVWFHKNDSEEKTKNFKGSSKRGYK